MEKKKDNNAEYFNIFDNKDYNDKNVKRTEEDNIEKLNIPNNDVIEPLPELPPHMYDCPQIFVHQHDPDPIHQKSLRDQMAAMENKFGRKSLNEAIAYQITQPQESLLNTSMGSMNLTPPPQSTDPIDYYDGLPRGERQFPITGTNTSVKNRDVILSTINDGMNKQPDVFRQTSMRSAYSLNSVRTDEARIARKGNQNVIRKSPF